MNPHAHILSDLLADLRSSLGASIVLQVLEQQEDRLTIQVGRDADAVVAVQIHDPGKPSFRISYPELKVKRNGDHHVVVTDSEGVVQAGAAWIVRQVAQHGAVRPEFMD